MTAFAAMRLLILNPNTSSDITERLRVHVAAALGSAATLQTATAPFGARYIADEASFAVDGHAALAAYAAHCEAQGRPDAVLLGCFGDPGIWALRELAQLPVVGLAEAAMHEAAAYGRFAIVTGGAAWGPMLRRLARSLGFAGALAEVHLVEPSGAQLAADPQMAQQVLAAACRRAAADAHAVILGGAALAGMAAQLAPLIEVPLIDSVSAGARAIVAGSERYLALTTPATAAQDWQGLSAALQPGRN
jgi:allantoin racemase